MNTNYSDERDDRLMSYIRQSLLARVPLGILRKGIRRHLSTKHTTNVRITRYKGEDQSGYPAIRVCFTERGLPFVLTVPIPDA